jgi:hypothetical protein
MPTPITGKHNLHSVYRYGRPLGVVDGMRAPGSWRSAIGWTTSRRTCANSGLWVHLLGVRLAGLAGLVVHRERGRGLDRGAHGLADGW